MLKYNIMVSLYIYTGEEWKELAKTGKERVWE
jgi:hypothetical protein